MAQTSWPSPNHGTPARSVTDAEYPHLIPWSADGIFPDVSDLVYANASGLEVHVRANRYALVRGHAWTSGSSEFNLAIDENASGSTRVDTVVMRLDKSTWDVTAAVRKGTPGAGAPSLQRDAGDSGMWEIPVADVTVANGAASIAAGNVKQRPLLQAGANRSCSVITDIQSTLIAGDIVYETSTGRWVAWNGSAGQVLYQDTGWLPLTLTNSAWTPSVSCVGRALNGFATLRVGVQRTGSTFLKSDPNGSPLLTLPSALRPAYSQYGTVAFSGGIGSARVDVSQSDGVVSLQHNTTDVAAARTATFTITYALG